MLVVAHTSSRLFLGRNLDRTQEGGGNRAYLNPNPLRVTDDRKNELMNEYYHNYKNPVGRIDTISQWLITSL